MKEGAQKANLEKKRLSNQVKKTKEYQKVVQGYFRKEQKVLIQQKRQKVNSSKNTKE